LCVEDEGWDMPTKTCALVERLQTIPDPRRQCENLKHPLVDIIMLGFCGVLAGCEDFVEIAEWGKEHETVLGTFLELPHGIPSHDTFNRVFAVLPPTTLQEVLLPWLLERRGLPGEFVHLDGKTLRGTRCKSQKLKALHVVSAWAGQTGLTLGQVAVDTKSNEITALPQLLDLLDLQDKIVTIDAMGCQTDLARAIVVGGGDYVLAVKGNQPTLHGELQAAFAQAPAPKLRSSRQTTTFDKGHGRYEQRTVAVLPAREYLSAAQQALWVGVVSLVMVTCTVWEQAAGRQSTEVRYFLSSLPPVARRLGAAIRGHWNIENGLHWVLDVVFREDARRVYDRTTAENVAFMHRLALSLLRGDTGKSSLKVKRKRAGWSIAYLMQLLGFSST
jgi:predicted transposase YbfD/YdcC